MTETEALQRALTALDEIDEFAENENLDAEDRIEEIRSITGSVIGDLARAGYEAEKEDE